MPERLIVSFRSGRDDTNAEGYVDQAIAVRGRAGALGASLCASSAMTLSFSLDLDAFEEALSLALFAAEDPVRGARRLSAGVAVGPVWSLGEGGSFAELLWGPPLTAAEMLAARALPGEVRLEPGLAEARSAELRDLGLVYEDGYLRRAQAHDASDPAERSAPSVMPPSGRISYTRPIEAIDADREAAPAIEAPAPVIEAPAPRDEGGEADPEEVAEALANLAKQALLRGDLSTLERLVSELRVTGEHGDLVERMSGMAALSRGATADALRKLRAATETAIEPAVKARALLAFGVALAGAGRTESALLEGLSALARAREAGDAHGEHACALFLARLSASAGHQDAALAWASVAARAAQTR